MLSRSVSNLSQPEPHMPWAGFLEANAQQQAWPCSMLRSTRDVLLGHVRLYLRYLLLISVAAQLPQIICAATAARCATLACASVKTCRMADDALFLQAHANDIRHARRCQMARHGALTWEKNLGWIMSIIICNISWTMTLSVAAALSYGPDDDIASSHAKASVLSTKLTASSGHAAVQGTAVGTSCS